jgi:hypothetical protein
MPPMRINNMVVDGIDFRFEDWRRGLNPQKERPTLVPLSGGEKFFMGNFSAPLPDGSWLNAGIGHPRITGNVGLKLAVEPHAQISMEPLFRPLPDYWYDFAIFYHGNDVVKPPEWPRSEHEGLLSQDFHPGVRH